MKKKKILHISRPQTIIQRFVPGETELRLAPTVQSDDTVFLTPGCQQSWQMQTVRSSCCHSLQMSAQIAEPTQPGANKLHVKLPSYLLPGLTGSKTHKKTILWSGAAFLRAEVVLKSHCDQRNILAMFSPFALDIVFPLSSPSINSPQYIFFYLMLIWFHRHTKDI